MNIYNKIGLSQNCDNEKLQKRVQTMLKFYYEDRRTLSEKLEILKNKAIKNIDDDLEIQTMERRVKVQIDNTNSYITELEKANDIFADMVLRIKYDNYLKINPKSTIEEFYKKDENIKKDKGENFAIVEQNNIDFKPIQKNNYLENNVKDVTYKRYLNQEKYELFFNEEKIRISILGRLDYLTTIGIRDLGFYKYKIEKTKINGDYDKFHSYNIFSGINIKRISEDDEYKNYNGKILLSDTNIKMAVEYNGGYVGEVTQNNIGKFCVSHRTGKIMCSY